MQPLRPPPAAVDALVAGSDRCALRWQCSPPRALRHRPPHNLCWQCPPPRPPLAASLPHYGTREIRSRLRQSTSRMNGLFAGGFWTRHALPGEIRTPRTFSGRNWTLRSLRVSECRPTTSLLSKSRPKTKRYPKVARQHHDVQISPKNTAASARKTRSRRTARAQPMAVYMQPGHHFMHHTRRKTPR